MLIKNCEKDVRSALPRTTRHWLATNSFLATTGLRPYHQCRESRASSSKSHYSFYVWARVSAKHRARLAQCGLGTYTFFKGCVTSSMCRFFHHSVFLHRQQIYNVHNLKIKAIGTCPHRDANHQTSKVTVRPQPFLHWATTAISRQTQWFKEWLSPCVSRND